jgi:methyl-accepting chemotaxis protein
VVASEVKTLANQTARATADIARQVAAIQDSTGNAADVLAHIARSIDTISSVASAVAGAVEQQRAATREIAERAQEAASSTRRVAASIAEVRSAAETSDTAAAEVGQAAEALTRDAQGLQQDIEHFLNAVRTTEDRRRFERLDLDLTVTVRIGGAWVEDRIVNISAGGARLAQRHALAAGTAMEVDIPGFGATIAARIAGVSDLGTHLQFPLDPAHLARVEAFIRPLGTAARTGAGQPEPEARAS